ncbi:hypothetical protein AALP_AA8G103900 [Arabis alpina]|uniref:Uncharacterized protein n=1 Tax=Arabis alpina TaxID=50452 RepID=A0A087G663_ARAAL|nr:hypothetical protein AALP_AA8G103900 [Arabis alpina]
MNRLIVFVLFIVMYFGLSEACAKNVVEIHNNLGPGQRLQSHCRYSIGAEKHDLGISYIKNGAYDEYSFPDEYSRTDRLVRVCTLRHGPNWMYHFEHLIVYRAARTRRCGQYRAWYAKPDGIYTREDRALPNGFALKWAKK